MTFLDYFRMGLENLWNQKLRTTLTVLGVSIGIGALISMVSFGTGLQKNVTDQFKKNELFTTIKVSAQEMDLSRKFRKPENASTEQKAVLNQRVLNQIGRLEHVDLAFQEINFPVKIKLDSSEVTTNLRGLPAELGKYNPYRQLSFGTFFDSDTEKSIIISKKLLGSMGIRIKDEKQNNHSKKPVNNDNTIPGDSLIGKDIKLITSVIKPDLSAAAQFFGDSESLFGEYVTTYKITGITAKESGITFGYLSGGAIVPLNSANSIPRLGFNSITSLLKEGNNNRKDAFETIHVRVESIEFLERVRNQIEKMGFYTFSLADRIDEMKKQFIIMDTALGAIGTVALLVAALGIINTMVMSILERKREIGIMKSIGASEFQIKSIFFIEAGTFGLIGGILGIILGWIMTKIASGVFSIYITRQGGMPVDLFYIPFWLVAAAMGFGILISLLAGLYPAARAASIDPVKALRHD